MVRFYISPINISRLELGWKYWLKKMEIIEDLKKLPKEIALLIVCFMDTRSNSCIIFKEFLGECQTLDFSRRMVEIRRGCVHEELFERFFEVPHRSMLKNA